MVTTAAAVLAAPQTPAQRPTFRSGVQLVEIDVRPADRSGRFVPDLGAGDFEVFEDGVPQPIAGLQIFGPGSRPASRPHTWLLQIDTAAGSPATLNRARLALEAFVSAHAGDSSARMHPGLQGFLAQVVQAGNVAVALDHGGLRTEEFNRVLVERPRGGIHDRAMGVDNDRGPRRRVVGLHLKPTQVQFSNRRPRQRAQIGLRVEPHVVRAQVDVADVAQQPAACAGHQFRQELRLRHRRFQVADITRRVFEQEWASDDILHKVNLARQH